MAPAPSTTPNRLSRRGLLILGTAIAGLAFHLLFFMAISIPLGPGPKELEARPVLSWPDERSAPDPLVEERSRLFDSAPLFVPTEWNVASSLGGISRLSDETELFLPFEPRLAPSPELWQGAWPAVDASKFSTEQGSWNAFSALGREPEAAPRFARRVARLSVMPFSEGEFGPPVIEEDVLETGRAAPGGVWSPLEFVLFSDPIGGGGPPLRLSGSGFPEWDEEVFSWIRRLAIGGRLPRGYYRVVVGP